MLRKAIALALSVLMTWSCGPSSVVPAQQNRQQTNGDRQTGPPPISPGAAVQTRLELPAPSSDATPEALKASFEAAAARIPAERYNPDAQARAVGPRVDAIFNFVRDRIRYEAYSGILRGSDGTLAARAGNSFDRSVLLARMLAVHGIHTRFARCELPRPAADTLFSRMFEGAAAPAAVSRSNGTRGTSAEQFWSRVTARARRDYGVIRPAVGNRLATKTLPSREQALRDIQRHAWVQADVDGLWLDLDTSFAAAKPGTTFCAAAQIVETIPADWHQRVTVRVTAERLSDGALTTSQVLQVTLPAVDLLDEEVFLVHVPDTAGRGGLGLGATAVQAGDRWAPALSIGADLQVGRPISFGNEEGSSFFGALGGGGGSSSAFVAEWLEFEVLRPDGRRDVVRRTLVDRASAAWRASKTHAQAALRPLARDGKGLLAPRAIHNVWFSAGPHNLRNYTDLITALSAAGTPDGDAPVDVQLLPLAAANFATLVWADHAAIPAVNDVPQVRLYSDSPRIVIVSVTATQNDRVVEEYDLRRDALFGVARDASADAFVVDRKIWFAALEGALEHEAVAQEVTMSGQDASSVASTSSLVTPDGVVAVGPSDADRVGQLTRDPEKAARMDAAVRSGNLLIVPRAVLAAGPAGWWAVTEDGNARAVLDNDLNGARGGINFNSGGGAKTMATRYGTVEIRFKNPPDPRISPRYNPNAPAEPRPPKQKKSYGLEYTLVLASVVLLTVTAVCAYGKYQRLAAYQIDVVSRAADTTP